MSCILQLGPSYDEQTILPLSFLGECPAEGLGDSQRRYFSSQRGIWLPGNLTVPWPAFVNGLEFARKSFMWLHCRWTVCSLVLLIDLYGGLKKTKTKKTFGFQNLHIRLNESHYKKKIFFKVILTKVIQYNGRDCRFWSQSDLV